MFSSAAADDLIGKRIIVGITYEDDAHRPVRQEQYHGRISRLNLQEGIVIQAKKIVMLSSSTKFVIGRTTAAEYREHGKEEILPEAAHWTRGPRGRSDARRGPRHRTCAR